MNYYERHLGDYARDTAHLSMLEHGAYTLLMDRYYATEQGIPADQVHRVTRARTRDERAAVDSVLSEFFTLVDGVWIQGRIEAELGQAQGRITAARENGKKGGRPRKQNPTGCEKKPDGFLLGSENETQKKALHLSNHQYSESNDSDAGASTETRPDPVWGSGLAFLVRKGIPERPARGLIGQLRKAAGDVQTGAILAEAESLDITNPAPWLMAAAAKARRANGERNGTDRKMSASEQTRAAIAERRRRESADAAH